MCCVLCYANHTVLAGSKQAYFLLMFWLFIMFYKEVYIERESLKTWPIRNWLHDRMINHISVDKNLHEEYFKKLHNTE